MTEADCQCLCGSNAAFSAFILRGFLSLDAWPVTLLSGKRLSIYQTRADHAELFVVAKASMANARLPASTTAQIREIFCPMTAR